MQWFAERVNSAVEKQKVNKPFQVHSTYFNYHHIYSSYIYTNNILAGLFTAYHAILSMVPSFWFDPEMMIQYGCAVIRVIQGFWGARICSPSTIIQYIGDLEKKNLGTYYYYILY